MVLISDAGFAQVLVLLPSENRKFTVAPATPADASNQPRTGGPVHLPVAALGSSQANAEVAMPPPEGRRGALAACSAVAADLLEIVLGCCTSDSGADAGFLPPSVEDVARAPLATPAALPPACFGALACARLRPRLDLARDFFRPGWASRTSKPLVEGYAPVPAF